MIPKRIYIKNHSLEQCDVDGIADARINATPYLPRTGWLEEYICISKLWHSTFNFELKNLGDNELVLAEDKEGYQSIATGYDIKTSPSFYTRYIYLKDLNPTTKYEYKQKEGRKGGKV